MENIIDKLNQLKQSDNNKNIWKDWSLEDKKKLLDIYFIISKKETAILDLIYSYHDCDSWEDILRDYDTQYFEDKALGVKVALENIIEKKEN